MHTLDLPTGLRDELAKFNPKYFQPVLIFTGRAFVGGISQQVIWDLSDRITEESTLSLDFTIPELTTGTNEGYLQAGELVVILANPDGAVSAIQDDAIFDIAAIESGKLSLSVTIGNQSVQVFSGKLIGPPTETADTTTLTAYDEIFKPITTALKYDHFGFVGGSTQRALIDGSRFIATPAIVDDVEYYDAIVTFREDGRPITTADVKGDFDLLGLSVKSGAKLGVYRIEFLNSTQFQISYPGTDSYLGSTAEDFESAYVDIPAGNWTGSPARGDVFEFQVRWNAVGNPAKIAKLLLERGFSENWGSLPGLGASSYQVDWNSFDDLYDFYRGYKIFVSEGNSDNSVWEMIAGNRPLSCLRLAQKVLDHIGAKLTMDHRGFIRVIGEYIGGGTVHEITDDWPIVSLRSVESEQFNYMSFQYGQNPVNGSYAATLNVDIRADQAFEKRILTFSFPYYRLAVSQREVESIATRMGNRLLSGPVKVEAVVLPSYGLTVMPGDRVRINNRTRPIITGNYWQVFSVQKVIGEVCIVMLIRTQDAEGEPAIYDDLDSRYNVSKYV